MWHLDPSIRLATIDMGRKVGAAVPPFGGGGAGSPSNTMSPAPKPTAMPSSIRPLRLGDEKEKKEERRQKEETTGVK